MGHLTFVLFNRSNHNLLLEVLFISTPAWEWENSRKRKLLVGGQEFNVSSSTVGR